MCISLDFVLCKSLENGYWLLIYWILFVGVFSEISAKINQIFENDTSSY